MCPVLKCFTGSTALRESLCVVNPSYHTKVVAHASCSHVHRHKPHWRAPSLVKFCPLCASAEKPWCRVFPAMGFPLLLVYPLPSFICVNSSGEMDKTSRLKKAVQEELVRVRHWPWQMGCIGWSKCGPSFQQSLVTAVSPLLTSVLAHVLTSPRWSQALFLTEKNNHQEPSGQPPLPPEAVSITTPSSLGMTCKAGPQIKFSSLKVWTLWRIRPLLSSFLHHVSENQGLEPTLSCQQKHPH